MSTSKSRSRAWQRSLPVVLVAAGILLAGCRQDMHNQAKYEALEESDFFPDGATSRVPPANTVARDSIDPTSSTNTGADAAGWVELVPFQVDEVFLRRGQQRFDIYCSPCHDNSGSGRGMIVQRGFKQPPSYHEQRLREMPIGYFYDVATNGYGLMSGYKGQIKLQDRWAIAAWIRVLQRSQYVPESELSAEQRQGLAEAETTTASAAHGRGVQ